MGEPGLITVTVHKARDIEKKGMFGKADPYVIMTYGEQKAKSKTIKNNYNPEWEFTAKFNIQKESAEGIKISVFDYDIGKDDALAMKVLDIAAVQEYQQLKSQWIPLESCKSGEVLISAEFTPQAIVDKAEKSIDVKSTEGQKKDTVEAESEDKSKKIIEKIEVEETAQTKIEKDLDVPLTSSPASSEATPKKKLERGQIHFTVIKAKDIEKKGKFGKADPYVKLTYGKQKAKSKTVKNNHNPEWNFEATFDIDENSAQGVNIAVFDDDFGKDDSLGNKTMDIIAIQEKQKLLNQWITLENCKSGEVLLSAEFIPLASVQKGDNIAKPFDTKSFDDDKKQIEPKISETIEVQDSKVVKQVIEESETTKDKKTEIESKPKEANKELVQDSKKTESIENVTTPVSTPKKILEPGQVLITVFKARDIEKKGKFGKADPYVKMTLGKHKAKSATVKNNHNPEWNFKASFDINESTTNEVSIAVFDEDFGKDDALGSTVLDLTQVQEQKQLLNQWIPLKSCKSGEVLISAELIPQAAVQKQKESEPLETIAKQDDTQKSSEI